MEKILCYGDSNTFGYNPKDNSRFDENIRWTSLLKKNLNGIYEIIEEGLCDRTGFVDNPKGALYSAQKHFPTLTLSFDFLILWIGTNDLQFQYNITFDTIKNGLKNLIKLAKNKTENIIIMPPVLLDEKVLKGSFSFQFDKTSIIKSIKTGIIYKEIADENNCKYFDINEFIHPSDFDGLHYDENSHKKIAEKLSFYFKK